MSGQTDDVTQPQRWIGRHSGTLLFTLTALVLAGLCTAGQPDGLTTYVLFLILLATSGGAALFGRLVRLPEFGRAFALGGCLALVAVTLVIFIRGAVAARAPWNEPLAESLVKQWDTTVIACSWGTLWGIWVLGWRHRTRFWPQVARAAGIYGGAIGSMMAAGILIEGPSSKDTWLRFMLFYVLTTLLAPAVFFLAWLPFWGAWRCLRRLRRRPDETGNAKPLRARLRGFLAWPKRSHSPVRWQYTLRALLLIILAVSIGLSWFRVKQEQARRQRDAIPVLARSCGAGLINRPPGSPWLLRKAFGDEGVSEVHVRLWRGRAADADLTRLPDLTNGVELILEGEFDDRAMEQVGKAATLRSLELSSTKVTDAGLASLRGNTELSFLSIHGACITDDGLKHLAGLHRLNSLQITNNRWLTGVGLAHLGRLSRLRSLDLGNSGLTDAGLQYLARRHPPLKSLSLAGTHITDAGMVHVGQFQELIDLNLWRTAITDAGLRHLKRITNLESLRLDGTGITDAGLAEIPSTCLTVLSLNNTSVTDRGLQVLGRIGTLRELTLAGTRITDQGLLDLARLPSLRYLNLSNTQVTPAGVDRLKKALDPSVYVDARDPLPVGQWP